MTVLHFMCQLRMLRCPTYVSRAIIIARAPTKCTLTDYRKELHTPHKLTKSEIAEHLVQYAEEFNLNVLLSATVQSTVFDPSKKKWTIVLKLGDGSKKTVTCQHFVQATGFGCGKPYVPPIPGQDLYRGVIIHSSQYRNPQILAKDGVKVRLRYTDSVIQCCFLT